MSRVLALDYGSARCGCAISDPTGTVATPLGVVERAATAGGLDEIAQIVADQGAERVIVGLPVTLAGREGAQAAETRAFAEQLEGRLEVPVDLHDERLTTRMAEKSSAAGATAASDSIAAAHLLESFLAARAEGGGA
jgi:putative Holliday junction resolvase